MTTHHPPRTMMSDAQPAARRRHGKPAEGLSAGSALRIRMRALVVVPAAASGALTLSADYLMHHPSQPVGAGQVLGGAVALSCIAVAAGWVAAGRIAGAVGRQRAADAAWLDAQRDEDRRNAENIVQQMTQVLADGIKAIDETLGQKGIAPMGGHGLPTSSGLEEAIAVVQSQVHTLVTRVQAAVDTSGRQEQTALITIGRRMIGLLGAASAGFDALVGGNEDPHLLEQVFALDHMVVRARRMAQSFALVGGARPQRSSRPESLFDVVGHAVGEVEFYRRVENRVPDLGVIRGEAAAGIVHLLAELIDNAANFSPPHTTVDVRGALTRDGVIVEIEDRGVPMPDERRQALNRRLSDPDAHRASKPLQDGQMGVWVVAEYANRLGLRVVLEPTPSRGNQAKVLIPHGLFEPRQGVSQRPVPVPLPEPLHAGPAAEPPQRRRQQPARSGLPLRREANSGPHRPPASAASTPQPSGDEVPDLPVRESDRSYLASGLQQSAAPPTAPSDQERDPTLLARFTQGRNSASADRPAEHAPLVPEAPAPRLPGDTDGTHQHQ